MDLLESLETGFQDLLGCIQNSLYLKVSWALLLRHDSSKTCAECLEHSMRYLHHGSWKLQHSLPFCWAPGISASTDRPLLLFCLSAMPETPWTAACQASLSFTISWSLLKLESIESVMASNHLILCHPLSFQWKLPWCWKRLTAGGKGSERGHYSYSLKLVIVRAFTPQKLASTTDQDFGIVMIIVLIADLPAHCCTYLLPQQSFDPNSLASPCWSLLCHVPVCVSYRDCRRNRIVRFFVSLQYHHDTMWNVSTLQCLLILFISPAWVQFFSKNFQMLSTWLKKKSSL